VTHKNIADAVLDALSTYNLHQQPNGEYLCRSPFRASDNSRAFCLKIDDPEHGTWHDRVTGEAGALHDLAQRLGISTPHQTTPTSSAMPRNFLKSLPKPSVLCTLLGYAKQTLSKRFERCRVDDHRPAGA
jgi:hypothetical protein